MSEINPFARIQAAQAPRPAPKQCGGCPALVPPGVPLCIRCQHAANLAARAAKRS